MDKKHAKWYYSVHAFPNKILWIIKYRWNIYDRYFSRKMDVYEGKFWWIADGIRDGTKSIEWLEHPRGKVGKSGVQAGRKFSRQRVASL